MRTIVALHLLGLSSPALRAFTSVQSLRGLRPYSDSDVTFYLDNIELAERRNEKAIARALRRCLNRREKRRVLSDLDRVFFGGTFRKLYQRVRGTSGDSLT
jgi:hypothetical protein